MKTLTVFFIIVGFLSYNSYTLAVLTVDDLEKIREIVDKSEVRIEKSFTEQITETKTHLSGNMQTMEKHLMENMQTMEKHLTERLEYLGTLTIALIVAMVGFVSVPMGLITYQYLKFRTRQDDEIKALREKIQELETKVLAESRSQIIQ